MLAPGSIVTVFGTGLASASTGALTVPLPTSLAGASLTVGGTAAPLYYAGAGQINAQIPFELAANTWLQVVSKTANAIAVPENITLDVARPGTQYNDNGSLVYNINGLKIPYPVDQALTINPFNMVNFFANYTIKNASWLRGSKIGLAVNNLADSHNIAGVTPAVAATAALPYVQNGGDLLNLLPGRSVMATLTVGYAPRR